MSKETKDWMERLVENYRIPIEKDEKKKSKPKRVLNESQLSKILNKD